MKDNGIWIVAALIIVVVLVLYVWFRLAKQRSKASKKVVSLSSYRKAATSNGSQKCTMCKQKAGKLTFYADHKGAVAGVCKECKPMAERKGMLPI